MFDSLQEESRPAPKQELSKIKVLSAVLFGSIMCLVGMWEVDSSSQAKNERAALHVTFHKTFGFDPKVTDNEDPLTVTNSHGLQSKDSAGFKLKQAAVRSVLRPLVLVWVTRQKEIQKLEQRFEELVQDVDAGKVNVQNSWIKGNEIQKLKKNLELEQAKILSRWSEYSSLAIKFGFYSCLNNSGSHSLEKEGAEELQQSSITTAR